MKVVDASVVLGWLLADKPGVGHRQILDAHVAGDEALVAPELIHYEVANVLAVGAGLPSDAAAEGYRRFVELEIETYSLGEREYAAAVKLACEQRVSVYDASYLVLALTLDTGLVTADRRMVKRLGRNYRDRIDVVAAPSRRRRPMTPA